MSGLMGAIGQGLSAAGYAAGDMFAKSALLDQQSDLELQRQMRLAEFKASLDNKGDARKLALADQARQDQAARIDAKTGQLADEQLTPKRGLIDAGITDPSTWTPEQQAAVDQSLVNDRQSLMKDQKLRTQAAIQTGDISPKDAMTAANSQEINQMKLDSLLQRADDKNTTAREIADIRSQAILSAAQLRVDAANERAANGKVDTATRRMLITSLDTDIRASTSQLNMLGRQLTDTPPQVGGKANPAYADIQSQIEELRGDIATSKKQKAQFFSDAGIAPAPDAAGTPAPKPRAAASGARPPLTTFLK